MKKHIGMLVLAGLVVFLLLARTVAITVDSTEIALVKRFGQTRQVYRGATDAGLKFKVPWPVESLVRYDGRKFIFEDANQQLQTGDGQSILVTTYCVWRIQDPVLFQASIKTVDAAQAGLKDLIRASKSSAFSGRQMSDLVNTDPKVMRLVAVEKAIYDQVAPLAMNQYGVEVVQVGIKNLGLPESATGAVIETMQKERRRKVDLYQSQGKAYSDAIVSRAEQAQNTILKFAEGYAKEIKAEGAARTTESYKKLSQAPEFAAYLRDLQTLEQFLQGNTTLIVDETMLPALRYLRTGSQGINIAAPTTQPSGH